jgi:hypothetical protein
LLARSNSSQKLERNELLFGARFLLKKSFRQPDAKLATHRINKGRDAGVDSAEEAKIGGRIIELATPKISRFLNAFQWA